MASFGNALRELGRAITGGGSNTADVRRSEDRAAKQPSYSAFSFKGLTSSDPANVARNQAAVARMNAAEAARPVHSGGDRQPAAAAAAAAAPTSATPAVPAAAQPSVPAVPSAPTPVNPSDMTSTGAAEDAVLESAGQGRASTIATSAQGLLADSADQLRRRRSIMSGGLIQ